MLAELGSTPLNDPGYEDTGVAADGSLTCLWRYPETDTGSLLTKISILKRDAALDMLNTLATAEGFTCYATDGGTRCEKTWQNKEYPVTDGRTVFWRDDILIDTNYSNLAPKGYTSSIVKHLFG